VTWQNLQQNIRVLERRAASATFVLLVVGDQEKITCIIGVL